MRDIERPAVTARIHVGRVVVTSKPSAYEGVPEESSVNVHTLDTRSGAVRGQLR